MAYQKNIKINQNNVVQISGSLITVTGSVSGSEISGSRLQSTIVSASNLFAGGVLYPTADGATGQVMVTDGVGTLTFQDPVANDLVIRVKNKEATTILKGTPCYVTASDTSGNIAGILRADADNPARMPAACVAFEDIDADAEGLAILAGFINGVDTSAFASGEAVYVGVGGGYTNVRPTGSALVQPLGYVEKVDSSNGSGVVKGPGHHYILPNATPDHLWIAGANGVPAEVNKEVFATTGSNTFTGNQIIDISSTSEALRVTQTGTGFAIRVEDSANPDSTPFVVTADGNVGVGTTTPLKKLHVSTSGLLIDGTSTVQSAPYSARLIVDSGTSVGHTLADLRNSNGSTLFVGGTNVGIGTNAPTAKLEVVGDTIISGSLTVTGSITELSTRRIKTNIESLNNELATVTKLNPVSYTRIDDGRREYGFISEEVKQVYPEFVIGEGINYPKMVSILVSAVKELSEKVEKQNREIQLLRDNKISPEVK